MSTGRRSPGTNKFRIWGRVFGDLYELEQSCYTRVDAQGEVMARIDRMFTSGPRADLLDQKITTAVIMVCDHTGFVGEE